MDKYTIYLVNQLDSEALFWCFLAPPDELAADPKVFANSSANLEVRPQDKASNCFIIPVQYVVGAGASNETVGLEVEIVSTITQNANLTDQWDANYVTLSDKQHKEGPTLLKDAAKTDADKIAIVTNSFNKAYNETNGWFSNQSFGIVTEAGFIGMTWSPEPGETRPLKPKLTFYVALGDYEENSLAAWTDVSNSAATVKVPDNFQYNECTVTRTSDGKWNVTKGKPASMVATAEELRALAVLDTQRLAGDQMDTLESVHWEEEAPADGGTSLVGTITVAQALGAAFTYFVLSGITFNIDKNPQGQTTVNFHYSGSEGASKIMALFQWGASLVFKGAK